jgi:hypothetical protein
VRVVDGQQKGNMVGEVDRQPVEPMQDGEAGVCCALLEESP